MIRVLPRDAFNDANLLKCIGKLTILIEDRAINCLTYTYDGEPFDIVQDLTSGDTFVSNIQFFDKKGEFVPHYRPLNSRDEYPLYLTFGENEHAAFSQCGKCLLLG